jgi:hypothetical protein
VLNIGKPEGAPIEEASCFFMFNFAIGDVMELYMKECDRSKDGIYWTVNHIN